MAEYGGYYGASERPNYGAPVGLQEIRQQVCASSTSPRKFECLIIREIGQIFKHSLIGPLLFPSPLLDAEVKLYFVRPPRVSTRIKESETMARIFLCPAVYINGVLPYLSCAFRSGSNFRTKHFGYDRL
jgi:hypothetical protein